MSGKLVNTPTPPTGQKEVKCVVWDLDHTLWDGILLEDNNVALKNGILDIIKELDARGIIQSIASKNNYPDGMAKLKEYGIDHYFLYPEINWNAKSHSVRNLHLRLNIGLDTFLFIDDQEFERAEVNTALPDVEVFDAREYRRLLDLPRLSPAAVTADAKNRREMYRVDLQRKEAELAFSGTPEEFLAGLDLVMSIGQPRTEEELTRMEELLIRTNRLNATKQLFSAAELRRLAGTEEHLLYCFELKDKFGGYGQVGTAVIKRTPGHWHLEQFAVSCRVISRNAADTFLLFILHEARHHHCRLTADYRKTGRNLQLYTIYRTIGFEAEELLAQDQVRLAYTRSAVRPLPSYISIERRSY